MIFACNNISKSYGINNILEKISFTIQEKEKVAIIGTNGAGKTTLFKIITNEIKADEGDIFLKKNINIGYLSQNFKINKDITIYDEIISVFKNIIEIENNIRNMEKQMSKIPKDELSKFMEKYSNLSNEFEKLEGYSYKSRIKGVLSGLGFNEKDYNKNLNKLSGGEKTRINLGKLLLTKPDILLLDEPTNHLDINSIMWLEEFLRSYTKTVLIISHDRYFIDKIANKVIEIENRKSTIYNGNYTYYTKQKEINNEIYIKQYINQQKEIKHQEEVINTLRSFNREKSIKRAESREKMLEKIEKIEKPKNSPKKIKLILKPRIISGKDVLNIENLSKSFNEKILFKNLYINIRRGEKIALIGDNGTGKSTLFKIILNEIKSDTGEIKIGTNVNIGYYDQEHQNLNESKTIFEEISDTYPNMNNTEIRNTLASFSFIGDDIFKKINSLSGGEKGRLALAKIMLSEANFLILDEPTNHLDMFSKQVLENAVNNYEGTILYISHDRYFINCTAQKIFHINNNTITEYIGNYDYFIEKKQNLNNYENLKINSNIQSEEKINWQKQKKEKSKERKIQNKIKNLEEEIEKIENKIKKLNELLFDEKISYDLSKTNDIYFEKNKLENELENLFNEWEKLQ